MRNALCWLLLVTFALWGPLDCLSYVAARRQPSAPAAASLEAPLHSAACYCNMCLLGKPCCCHPAKDLANGLCMKARCEDPDSRTLTAKVAQPLLLPAVVMPTTDPILPPTLPHTLCASSLRRNPVSPLHQPPRSMNFS